MAKDIQNQVVDLKKKLTGKGNKACCRASPTFGSFGPFGSFGSLDANHSPGLFFAVSQGRSSA